MTDIKAAFTLEDTFTTTEATALVDRLRATFRTGRTKPLAWRRKQLTRLRGLLTERRGEWTSEACLAAMRADVAEVLAMELDRTHDEVPLEALGIDSLAAIEIAARLRDDHGLCGVRRIL